MSELGDILGEEFEQKYEEKRQRAREEATKISKETMMEIAHKAINSGGFKGEEPRFMFKGENVDHDVMLMESPDRDLQKFRHKLGEDAISMGMFHVDTLFSCAFQSNMIDLVDKIEEGQYYMVIGRYQEKTQSNSSGDEKVYYNINPVRGMVPLSVAKRYADEYQSQLDSTSIEEQSEKQSDESEPDLSGLDGDEDDDDGPSEDEVVSVLRAIGNKASEVLEGVADGDDTYIEKLITVTNNNLDKEADREFILDVFEDNVEPITGRGESEDGDIDIGDLDEDEEPDGKEDESSSNDGNSDPSDWF